MTNKHMGYMKYMRHAYDRIMAHHIEILGTGSSVYKYEIIDNKYVFLNDRSDMMFTILGISESEMSWDNIRKKEIILLHGVTMRIFLLTIEIERMRPWGHPEIVPMLLDESRMYVEELQDVRNPNSSWDREGRPLF